MNNTSMRAPLTLDSEKARWLGVCAGIARWLDLPIALVRVIFVICVISWPTLLLAYVITYSFSTEASRLTRYKTISAALIPQSIFAS